MAVSLVPATRVRHLKLGSTYKVVGVSSLQAAISQSENDQLVIYQPEAGDTNRLWARPLTEFQDGRFEQLEPLPASPPVPEFFPGDVVYLKSGSGKMTVEFVHQYEVALVYNTFNTPEVRKITVRKTSVKLAEPRS